MEGKILMILALASCSQQSYNYYHGREKQKAFSSTQCCLEKPKQKEKKRHGIKVTDGIAWSKTTICGPIILEILEQ